MAIGRNTKCTDALVKKAQMYIDGGYEMADHLIPSIAGLAKYLKVHRETLRLWGKDKKNPFFGILEDLSQTQLSILISRGLSGEFNSAIAKLVLAKHGFSEKQEIDHTTAGESINKIERVIVKGGKSKD